MPLSARAYQTISESGCWEEVWEAGSYFQRVSELLEQTRSYAIFTGWQLDSRISLCRPTTSSTPFPREMFREKLVRLCEEKPNLQIFILMWDHAYFYCVEREIMQGRIWEDLHPRIHVVFDNRHPLGGAHHIKSAVFDGKVALCGGIDLCDDRWDSPQHLYSDPRRSLHWKYEHHGPYHDASVQVSGQVCQRIQQEIGTRWSLLSSVPFPKAQMTFSEASPRGHAVYLSRTRAEIDPVPGKPVFTREVEFLFKELIASAENRIVIEGQYYWSPAINDTLIQKCREKRGQKFGIFLVLPDLSVLTSFTRFMAMHELKLLRKLDDAARDSGVSLTMGAPYVLQTDRPPKPIYVHSKVIIIDDRYLSIGSANLSSRALRLDTELVLTMEGRTSAERNHIRRTADSILRHWSAPDVTLKPFRPREDIRRLRRQSPWISRVPWEIVFDPDIPWFFPLKWRWRSLLSRRSWAPIAFWATGAAAATWLGEAHGMGLFYSVLLYSAWILPIPFTALALVASLHLGPTEAPRLVVAAFWTGALLGYLAGRVFPSFAAGIHIRAMGHVPSEARRLLGQRTFKAYLIFLATPRAPLRMKFLLQGMLCIPLPWFVLGTGLILPSVYYLGCYALGHWVK